MKTIEKLQAITTILEDMKADDLVTIDAAEKTIMADHFVVVTATSNTHAKAIADQLHVRMKANGVRAGHLEIDAGREWTVLDYGDIVIHIFQERARRFYNLEELWGAVKAVRETKEASPKRRSR